MTTGKLYLVGLGPGAEKLMTPAASQALALCDVVVGYGGYIQQVRHLLGDKEVVAMELGQEMERASAAAELAWQGRTVAVISSGDPGVYGMAAPVFQHLASLGWDGASPEVEVVPGISAMQAASALLGAPLMQDFCAISLSDLLTPWQTIRRRIEAAALGDFVVVIYNPRSRKRDWQLSEARDVLLERRPGNTPVGIVRNATRPDQSVRLTTLEGLQDHLDSIDMFTALVIGNSTTFVQGGRMITPRGYEGRDATLAEGRREGEKP